MSVKILKGDCRDVLRSLDADSVQTCITSPPYWGLRDYGIPPSVWGGDPDCEHEWAENLVTRKGSTNGREGSTLVSAGAAKTIGVGAGNDVGETKQYRADRTAFCRCGAWRGSFGLEPTYPLYVDHAVDIFREVRRVLRPDGTLWLNLGDSYATGAGKVGNCPGGGEQGDPWNGHRGSRGGSEKQPHTGSAIGPIIQPNRMPQPGLKAKDLCGIPWRVAFALQTDGWYLRSDIIWSKPNQMPESVTDRPTKAHEYLFLFAKSERYFYDAEAIKERGVMKPQARLTPRDFVNGKDAQRRADRRPDYRMRDDAEQENATRNKRSVWEVATAPFTEAHFAVFPPDLIEPCVKAGTGEKGCCTKCGSPWIRQTDREQISLRPNSNSIRGSSPSHSRAIGQPQRGSMLVKVETVGWEASCDCGADVAPCTVLDPFLGAGTTALVADRLGRDCIGIELNPEYADMAKRRIEGDAGMFAEVNHG